MQTGHEDRPGMKNRFGRRQRGVSRPGGRAGWCVWIVTRADRRGGDDRAGDLPHPQNGLRFWKGRHENERLGEHVAQAASLIVMGFSGSAVLVRRVAKHIAANDDLSLIGPRLIGARRTGPPLGNTRFAVIMTSMMMMATRFALGGAAEMRIDPARTPVPPDVLETGPGMGPGMGPGNGFGSGRQSGRPRRRHGVIRPAGPRIVFVRR